MISETEAWIMDVPELCILDNAEAICREELREYKRCLEQLVEHTSAHM